MPEPRPTFEIKAYAFSNSADIAFEIRDAAGVEIDRAFGAAALIDEGISATRSPQLTGPLAPHVEVSPTGAKLSPARCANGGTFAMSCNDGNGGMGGMGGMGGAGGMGGGMPPACDPPGVDELVINEVLIDGLAPEETTEFIELVNTAARPVAVAGLSIHSTSGASLRERVRLTGGCLPARSAIAIFRDGHSLSHPEELAPITYSDIS
ncbi:MAG: hypothetical protein KC620_26735, partial [Myxococcales bacterium]|nr:hypothetical protein [Myxococcales bacterium]